ncbi:protein kinase domain-containing protein [Nocardia higoensis]|uniref:protein kinase domain-containing protein n=1 Tax=Nocardia higoensis TaxID=228599 RepID=UPI00030D2879|nr:protein kinase [Nocardia higoensis]
MSEERDESAPPLEQTQRAAAPNRRGAGPAETEIIEGLNAAGFEDPVEIGRGGFGVVYRCRQPDLDRTVAVKVLTAFDGQNTARFLREERAMGRLTGHPNIVDILQIGSTGDGHPFIVMPYYALGSLADRLRTSGPFGHEDTVRIGVKIAGALAAAHRMNILHRDVKPANILLSEYGEPALTDFGIAHLPGGFETAAGLVTGSPAYTAPEILSGAHATAASDIYGLGATLLATLTGHAAFERRSGEKVVAHFVRVVSEPTPDLGELGVAEDVAAVIDRAMSPDPADRPSAVELADELRACQARHGFAVDYPSIPAEGEEPRRRSAVSPAPTHRAAARNNNLPAELTSFVGRRQELSDAKNVITSTRLLTLTGMSGVGKTRLALRIMAGVQRKFRDGVWLVELADLHDPSLLVPTIMTALGIRELTSQPAGQALDDFLDSRQILVALDSCESSIDEVAALAATLLRSHADLHILATSIEPLGVRGEVVLPVSPMAVPDDHHATVRLLQRTDTAKLFADRATAADPAFAITDANKTTVAQICRRLDGLPLAVELAAARLRTMTLEQLAAGLTDRWALLTRGARDAPSRQQTLRAGIDWTYELCTDDEQRMWARLSVFAGSFELSAAQDICGDDLSPAAAIDLVAALVDKSIVIRAQMTGESERLQLLDAIRQYGREKAVARGEYEALRERHLHWYSQLVLGAYQDWISPRQLDWMSRVERERSNLREAQEYNLSLAGAEHAETAQLISAGLVPYWLSRGLLSEGRHWLERALSHTPEHGGLPRARALLADGVLASVQKDFPAQAATAREIRALAEAAHDPAIRTIAAKAEGYIALYEGEGARACALFEQDTARGPDEGLGTYVWDQLILGVAYDLDDNFERARTCLEEVLAITDKHGESVYRSYALWALGTAYFRHGDLEDATRLLHQGLRLTNLIDAPLTRASGLEVLAWVACRRREFTRAATLLGAASAMGAAIGSSSVMFGVQMRHHDQCERDARSALGERAFDSAYRTGSRFDSTDAVAYALGERQPGTATTPGADPLTAREREIAALVAQGNTNSAIAAKLFISPRTVAGHVEHILAKLGFTSRTQIAAWVHDTGDSTAHSA